MSVKFLRFILFITASFLIVACQAVNSLESTGSTAKSEDEVFSRWKSIQNIRYDIDINELSDGISNQQVRQVVNRIPRKIIPQIIKLIPELDKQNLTDRDINNIKNKLTSIYRALEYNVPNFISMLEKNSFSTSESLNHDSRRSPSIYSSFMESIMINEKQDSSGSIMSSVANRLFEYCYYPETFKDYLRLVETPEQHSILMFLNETIWYYLARSEWSSWQYDMLKKLKDEYDNGKEIVYIAGGSDIYQLINHGIYDIVNIDPIYPTQTRYYSEGWEFLAKGNIGDIINFSNDIQMRRHSYSEDGFILENETIYGKQISIPNSITVWVIEDSNGNKLGTYKLKRRFVEQDDFQTSPDRVFLISFNELYFILNTTRNNWGINPREFDRNFKIYAKQLRAPISYKVLMNMREIQESSYPHVFGSSVIGD